VAIQVPQAEHLQELVLVRLPPSVQPVAQVVVVVVVQ
jgi:hypothetical protein